jgi:hypothetical protein
MSYKPCPHCGASNPSQDPKCYSCSKPLDSPRPTEASDTGSVSAKTTGPTGEVSLLAGFLAISLSMLLGGVIGFGFSVMEFGLPFFLEEILLGTVCATATAFCLGKFQEMPEGLLFQRLYPAAAYGALVGFCLYAIWWTFDPSAGFVVIGVIAGFCSGLPIAVSFGLAGGESRPLGSLEFTNVVVSVALGALIGVFLGLEVEEFSVVPGAAGILGLVPTMFGGRINLYEIFEHFD